MITRGGTSHYPSSHIRARSETQSNLRFVIRVSNSLANSRKEINNGRTRVRDTTFHTYAYAALCRTPPFFRVRVAPRHSREFSTFSPGTFRGRIFLTRYPICVFFSLLECYSLYLSNGLRHAPIQHQKIFLCYFNVFKLAVNFQRN